MANSNVKAIFARHAEVKENRPGYKLAKGLKDYPLDSEGKKESQKLAARVARYKPTVVLASPLQRATHPAQATAKAAGVPLKVEPDLKPWDFGQWAGKPAEEIEPKLADMAANHPEQKTPGGESFNSFLKRSDRGYRKIKLAMAQGERPAVITHSRNLREIQHGMFGGKAADPTKGGPEPSGFMTLSRRNKLQLHGAVDAKRSKR
jgi:broad specificity phosphatase PhoE